MNIYVTVVFRSNGNFLFESSGYVFWKINEFIKYCRNNFIIFYTNKKFLKLQKWWFIFLEKAKLAFVKVIMPGYTYKLKKKDAYLARVCAGHPCTPVCLWGAGAETCSGSSGSSGPCWAWEYAAESCGSGPAATHQQHDVVLILPQDYFIRRLWVIFTRFYWVM